ncbi:MAG: hypothetical protein P4M12_09610 [Gammaproteobacteria bacterium]|nr:hypothetical protein [Gammaproteobacteria bacterium]
MHSDPRIDPSSSGTQGGSYIKCFSWTAITVGALVGIGLSFLFNLFSLAFGLTAFQHTQEGMSVFAIGGFLGLVAGTVVSMFIAGYTAGRIGRLYTNRDLGLMYGFTTWCLMLIITVLLASNMGQFTQAHTSVFSNLQGSLASNVIDTAPITEVSTDKQSGKTMVTVAANKTSILATTTFITFFLFLMGAAATCFGGQCAFSCKKSECCPSKK